MYAYGKEKSGEDDPLVSVVLPAGRAPALLTEALQSVLSQTYGNFEVIVVGGEAGRQAAHACSDGRVIHLPFEGEEEDAEVRAGAEAAQGEFVAYLDAAAVYHPCHLDVLVRHMRGCGCPFAFSPVVQVLQVWVTDRYVTVGKRIFFSTECDRLGMHVTVPVPLSSVMHRRDVTAARDMIGEGIFPSPDGILVRLPERHGFCRLSEPSLEIRSRTSGGDEMRDAALSPVDAFGQSKDACIAFLEGRLKERKSRIRDLEGEIEEKERRITCLEEMLREKEQRLCDLEDGMRVSSFYLSHLKLQQGETDAQTDCAPGGHVKSAEARNGRE